MVLPIQTSQQNLETVPEPTAMAHEVQLSDQPPVNPSQMPKSRHKVIIAGLLALVLGLLGVIGYLLVKPNVEQSSNQEKSPTELVVNSPVTTEIEGAGPIELIYIKNDELWAYDSSGQSTQISQTNGTIYDYGVNADNNLIAYISGTKNPNPNGYPLITPTTVHLYDSITEQTKQIYELTPQTFPQSEYSLFIRDVGVSPDGSKVAITTSDSLFVYDIESEALTTIFSLPVADPLRPLNGVFSYSSPVFSPDNNNLVYNQNYYEGSEARLVNLATKEIKDLSLSNYMTGDRFLGWLDNFTLLVGSVTGADVGEFSTQIKALPIATNKSQNIGGNGNIRGSVTTAALVSGNIYLISQSHEPNPSILPESGVTFLENYYNIYHVNSDTGETTEMYRVKEDTIQPNARSYTLSNLKISKNGTVLYLSGQSLINSNPPNSPTSTPIIMSMDPINNTPPTEMIQNASF